VNFGAFQPPEQLIELLFRLFLSNVALSQQGEKEAENWPIYAYFAMCLV
jgi:hypothetical protein